MKAFYILIMMLSPAFVYSQTKEDYRKIIEMIVSQKHDDTTKSVYCRFDNKLLIEELGKYHFLQESKFLTYYTLFKDSLEAIDKHWISNNIESTDTFSFFGVLLNYQEAMEIFRQSANKRISAYCKFKFIKNKKELPLMSISIPVFSVDGKMAVANYDYRCKGNYCGDTQFFIFRKVNGVWKIVGTGPAILY